MSLLRKLNATMRAIAEKENVKFKAQYDFMVQTYESQKDKPNVKCIYIHPDTNPTDNTFYPQSLEVFNNYLKKNTATVFQITYLDKNGKNISELFRHTTSNSCASITIDNRTPEMIAELIGTIFSEKTKDISAIQHPTIFITFKEILNNDPDCKHPNTFCVSRSALLFIRSAVEKHIGEFNPTANSGSGIKWKHIYDDRTTAFFDGIEFIIDSPIILKRKRE